MKWYLMRMCSSWLCPFNRKGNEFQYKFNVKEFDSLDDYKSHLECDAVDKAKESISEGMSMLGREAEGPSSSKPD